MEQIGSNSHLGASQVFFRQQPQKPAAELGTSRIDETSRSAHENPSSRYSEMFEDDALFKLQGNLEAIAKMAESALKRIDG